MVVVTTDLKRLANLVHTTGREADWYIVFIMAAAGSNFAVVG